MELSQICCKKPAYQPFPFPSKAERSNKRVSKQENERAHLGSEKNGEMWGGGDFCYLLANIFTVFWSSSSNRTPTTLQIVLAFPMDRADQNCTQQNKTGILFAAYSPFSSSVPSVNGAHTLKRESGRGD